jgi:hypothetical protein
MKKPKGYKIFELPENTCAYCKKCEISEQSSSIVYPPGYNYNCSLMPMGDNYYNGNTQKYATCDEFEINDIL